MPDDIVIPSFGDKSKKKAQKSNSIVIPKFDDEEESKPESFLGGIKKKADKFILAHLDELAQKKPGVLNPNPSENPLIDKPLAPEATGATSTIGKVLQGGYNQIVRPFTSPLGIVGSLVDPQAVGDLGPDIKPRAAMEVKPPVWEANKPRLALPPSSLEKKTSFIGTPEGQVVHAPSNLPTQVEPPTNLRVNTGVKTITRPEGLPVEPVVPKPIEPTKKIDPKTLIKDWANGRTAARQYGKNAAKDFAELNDPSLVEAYQRGDRTGKLAEVEQHLEGLRQAEVKAGILPEDAKKANYLRQYWEQSPEQVDAAFAPFVAKNPNFAKESVFSTYRQGIAAGLTPKFNTLPEILEARTAEGIKAIKNKELYDYLIATKKIKPQTTIPDTQNIDKLKHIFVDPNEPESKKIIQYMGNYLGDSNSKIKRVADLVSVSKNVSLGGGVPGTKYNIHGWNTAKSDAKLRGFGNAIMEFATDPTGKAAEKIWEEKPNRDLLAKLIEKGYTYHPVEDMGKNLAFEGTNPISRGANKVLEATQKTFEKPLFERSLPAMKFKGAKYALDKMTASGMNEDEALKKAAQIANEFYGGMNKVIRDKTFTNDASRIVALAPDWLESRLRLAINDWKGTARTIAGKGDARDLIHTKSLARGAVIAGAGAGAATYLGRNDKPQDVTNVPIGKDAKGKSRLIDVLGTADESMRLPIQIPLRAAGGDPLAALDMLGGNKMSTPARSAINLAIGKNNFENIRGKDKYGRRIPVGKSIAMHLDEATKPFQYQGVQGFVDYMRDNASAEEVASKALELPLKYEQGAKQKKVGGLKGLK